MTEKLSKFTPKAAESGFLVILADVRLVVPTDRRPDVGRRSHRTDAVASRPGVALRRVLLLEELRVVVESAVHFVVRLALEFLVDFLAFLEQRDRVAVLLGLHRHFTCCSLVARSRWKCRSFAFVAHDDVVVGTFVGIGIAVAAVLLPVLLVGGRGMAVGVVLLLVVSFDHNRARLLVF